MTRFDIEAAKIVLDADKERKARVQRMVADQVLQDEEIFTLTVGELSDKQVAFLRAALEGAHAEEIMAKMDEVACVRRS